jgi:protein involved in polysaccharide export with SLBB domain
MFTRATRMLDSQAIARQAMPVPTNRSAMRRILATVILLVVSTIIAAQTPTRERRSSDADQTARTESNTMRDRVVGPKSSNHVEAQKSQTNSNVNTAIPGRNQEQTSSPTWGNTAFIVRPSSVERSTPSKTVLANSSVDTGSQQATARKLVQQTSLVSGPARPESLNSRSAVSARAPIATSTYNVGIGDVLDVRLSNVATRESTLFTVQKNGTLEYPLLNGPISVAGLSTDEISGLLSSEIKVIKSPRIAVSVRDYASHTVVIGGLVENPGRKILRREAMPLFAVLAEALVRPEATTATILRNGKEGNALALKDEQAMTTLVLPGDVIKISGGQVGSKQYLYVGGEVTSPGEKAFREGMTLTQALLSAGGAARSEKTIVKLARRNANGFLSTTEHNLRSIEEGKSRDPALQAGDRIEVMRRTQ